MRCSEHWGKFFFIFNLVIIVTACSGDDGIEGGGGKQKISISGTAAIGAPISDRPIAAKTSEGTRAATTTQNNGKFSISVKTAGAALLKVDTQSGAVLYSIASRSGITNIHPFTDLIIRNWFKVRNLDIDAEFAADKAFTQLPSESEITTIQSTIEDLLANALLQYDVAKDVNIVSIAFDANGTGFDAFLHNSQVLIINNNVTVIIKDPETQIESEIVKNIGLNTDLTLEDDEVPSVPNNLRAFGVSGEEVIILWEPSSDNIGVAGYNVYRNGSAEPIAVTPYPVLSDTGLQTATEYCYEVEAVDAAGNISAARAVISSPLCPVTDGVIDNVAPQAPNLLQATSQNDGSIKLTWNQNEYRNVQGFHIYRGSRGNVDTSTVIATLTTTSYNDFNLDSNNEYCYLVTAYGVTDLESVVSNEACSTTLENSTPQPGGQSKLSFSATNYQASEDALVAEITVTRSGEISAAISVDYATKALTASEELDFNPVSGRLMWAANDSSPRTITVTVKPDALVDDNETFSVTLSNYSAFATAGDTTEATVTINDSVPCSNTLTPATLQLPMTIDSCTIVDGTINVSDGVLTISPGVSLIFTSGSSISVKDTGSLIAAGSELQPILFTGQQAVPGYWDGLEFVESNSALNELRYATVEYGGSASNDANLYLNDFGGANRIRISNSVFRKGLGYGIVFDTNSVIDQFEKVSIHANDSNPVYLPANLIGLLGSDSHYSGNNIDQIKAFASSSVNDAQTWAAIDVPYFLTSHLINAALTIEAGSILIFDNGGKLDVQSGASLSAIGTSQLPILFTGSEPTPGYWDGLVFTQSNSAANELAYVTVEYGGNTTTGANLKLNDFGQPNRIKIRNSSFRNGAGHGLYFDSNSLIDQFENITSNGNQLHPVTLPANLVGKLGDESDYSGNTLDSIKVFDNSSVNSDQTWATLNVPYFVSTHSINAALTLTAGTTLIFNSGGEWVVQTGGSLNAVGTEQQPILFTSSDPTPGSWKGIEYVQSNSSFNELAYVTIEYGGLDVGDANLHLNDFGSPNRIKIRNCTFQKGAANGIVFDSSSIIEQFENSTITENESYPVSIYANLLRHLGSDTQYTGNSNDRINVYTNSSVSDDQTWAALDVPYSLQNHNINAVLNIDAGSILEFRQGGGFAVQSNGALFANGVDDNQRVVFTSATQAKGSWDGLLFTESNNGNTLNFAIVEYAGGGVANGANIELNDFGNPVGITINNSIIRQSSGWGLKLDTNASINADYATVNSYADNTSGNYCGTNDGPAC